MGMAFVDRKQSKGKAEEIESEIEQRKISNYNKKRISFSEKFRLRGKYFLFIVKNDTSQPKLSSSSSLLLLKKKVFTFFMATKKSRKKFRLPVSRVKLKRFQMA